MMKKYVVMYEGNELGSVITNGGIADHSMNLEEIYKLCGVDLAHTEDEYEHSPENGKYIIDDLYLVERRF